jgi:hypothetical protein
MNENLDRAFTNAAKSNYLESLNPTELCSQKMDELYGSALQGEARQQAIQICTGMVSNYIEAQK